MRLICFCCGKSVSNELPENTTVRAALACPECVEARKAIFTTPIILNEPDEKFTNELKI